MSLKTKMTALADAIRSLSGTTGAMGIESMTNTLTGIPKNDSSKLTVSGATVTVPAGCYASQATKSVATATQATPSVSIDSAGKITATATQTAGYVSAGTKTGTKQLTTQAAKTITPNTSSQTAVAKNVYTTGAVTVAAIPSTYVKPTATKAATTYTPGTSNQTISAGTYCSGAQTIKGDANLKAENIAEGVSIFGVTGTHSGSSGGTSGTTVKTCTLDGLNWSTVCYTTVENGTIMYKAVTFGNSSEPITVLCDSIIYYEADGDPDPGTGVVLTGGFEELYSDTRVKHIFIKAPSTANASGTFSIEETEPF